ncbi:RRP15-like protein [Macadamia integrifolia]|uniref:RRP15-like protein n=1 Tax=Macadamia integrifolia TaxID=60698 RepID=UPI001C52B6D5|nr:RRP15-like protein [Macadamia integrifolia]
MAEESHLQEKTEGLRKRKIGKSKGRNAKKRMKSFPGKGERVKIDKKMQKMFRRRAKEYNSDDEDDEQPTPEVGEESNGAFGQKEVLEGNSSGEEEENVPGGTGNEGSDEDEGDRSQPGITKFVEGCRAFRIAFMKITKKNMPDNPLGPVLSAQKKLVAKKLAEEEAEWKSKGEARKEKQLVGEKGHVKPANFLDSHEKFLLGVATKGVVKLFNAVNKAQNAQKGLNPSRFKDAKALGKRRKDAFFSELRKTPSHTTSAKDTKHKGPEADEAPAWAPLRDEYMLTSSKLKDWDKMPETAMTDDMHGFPLDNSSDED